MGLLSEKTVVYVTHQLEFLNSSDLILVIFVLLFFKFITDFNRLHLFSH